MMEECFSLLVEDAQVQGPSVQIDAAVVAVLFGIKVPGHHAPLASPGSRQTALQVMRALGRLFDLVGRGGLLWKS
jgi:hypothetical protein